MKKYLKEKVCKENDSVTLACNGIEVMGGPKEPKVKEIPKKIEPMKKAKKEAKEDKKKQKAPKIIELSKKA